MTQLHPGAIPEFDPLAVERRFEPLDALSRRLWLGALTNTEGEITARISALAGWHDTLMAGRPVFSDAMRRESNWPGPDVAEAFGAIARRLELHQLTHRHEEITVQVMQNLLWHIDRIALVTGRVGRTQAVALAAEAFESDWDHQSFELKEVLRVFESLDGVQNFARFAELSGLLQQDEWQAVLRAHAAMATLADLAALIRRLGRARPAPGLAEQPGDTRQQHRTTRQWVRRWTELDLPGGGFDTQGVRRSGELARMLASEVMQWRRSASSVGERRARRLRRLFAARLAEHGLLTYEQRSRQPESAWVLADAQVLSPRPQRRPPLMRGPLIICIDTSSSMAGGPEAVGKAVVLEAMKTAHRERRDCRVYAFSGPGDLRAFDLPLTVDGIFSVAGFLSASFHGGTDIVDPIDSALDDIEQSRWQGADIIIASDGEFGATASTHARIDAAKASQALRIQGILIGDRETRGLRAVCDDIFWVSDWRRFGNRHGQSETVVHDKNLTGIYFPKFGAPPEQ